MRMNFLPAIGLLLASSGLALAQTGPADSPTVLPVAAEAEAAPALPDTAPSPRKEAAANTGPAVPLSETALDTFACPAPSCGPKCKLETPPPPGCWWVSSDYMLRWFKRSAVPGPLLVTGPASSNGIAGAPGTTSFGQGNNFLNFGAFSGVQMNMGFQVPDGPFGFEFGGFILEQRTTGFGAGSDPTGNPVVALPFINAQSGVIGPDRLLAAFPGAFIGNANVTNTARMFGAEANVARCAFCCGCLRGDVLAGFRYLNLSEQINIQSISVDVPPASIGTFNGQLLPPNTVVTSADTFSTQNHFGGAQVGGRLEWHYNSFYVLTTGKVALGVSDQIVNIGGLSTAFAPGSMTPTTALGGVYALPSNIGRTNHPEFAAVPELGLTFGFQLTQRLRIYCGYSALYWSNVVRPGDQISPTINRSQIPLSSAFAPVVQPTQPFPFINRTDFWMQGADIGLAFHF